MLQGEHSAILSTFIKLSFVIKIFVLSIFEWPLKTGFTVCVVILYMHAQLSSGHRSVNFDHIPTSYVQAAKAQATRLSIHCPHKW